MASRLITDCVPELQNAWHTLKSMFEKDFKPFTIFLTCTYRSPDEQFEIYQQGREYKNNSWVTVDRALIKTNCDGKFKLSMHNHSPSKAFDVAILSDKKMAIYNYTYPCWQKMPEYAEIIGIVNGGSWEKLKDWPHFQVK